MLPISQYMYMYLTIYFLMHPTKLLFFLAFFQSEKAHCNPKLDSLRVQCTSQLLTPETDRRPKHLAKAEGFQYFV